MEVCGKNYAHTQRSLKLLQSALGFRTQEYERKKIIHTFIERKHIIIDQHHNYINSASMQREKEKNNSRIILNK